MALHPSRREALLAAGGLGAWAAVGPRAVRASSRPAARPDDAIEQLSAALRDAPRSRAFDVAADAIRSGARVETLLGAVLRIGVEDVRPRPHGILHTVMMVHSSFALAEGASVEEAWLAALWNLDDLGGARERDREEGDWRMPARPSATASTPERARAELVAAMDGRDAERADRAVVALLPWVDRDRFFELMWPFAARCSTFLGHKIIYAANLERALRRIGIERFESAARSLVRTLLVDRDTDSWDATGEHAAALSARTVTRAPGNGRALQLYRQLRAADVEVARSATLDALDDGADAESVWSALRLVASETFHRRSGRRSRSGRDALLPVHALTVVNALRHAARSTRDATLAWRCLLEAVSRLPAMRAWLVASTGLATDAPPLDTLGTRTDEAPAELADALASGSPEVVCAHLRRGETSLARYAERMRASLLRTAREHHQHKYAAAALEEASLVAPELRALVLAPTADYVLHPEDETTEVHARSLAALRRAGLR